MKFYIGSGFKNAELVNEFSKKNYKIMAGNIHTIGLKI